VKQSKSAHTSDELATELEARAALVSQVVEHCCKVFEGLADQQATLTGREAIRDAASRLRRSYADAFGLRELDRSARAFGGKAGA
jgi:hypothetical protein